MRDILNPKKLPALTIGLGGLGFLLRWLLYWVGEDEKGLLTRAHPMEVLLWILTAAAAVLIVAMVWKLDGSNRYADNFRSSVESAAGAFVLAIGIFVTLLGDGKALTGLEKIRRLVGYLSVAALAAAGVSRFQGKRPLFVFHALVCAFFGIHMVSRYQVWSGDPQLQDHVFNLFACVSLTLFAFYQAAFDVGSGKRRMQLAMGLLAVFTCLTALANTEHWLLYLTGAVWAVTNLCSLTPVARRQREKGADTPDGKA